MIVVAKIDWLARDTGFVLKLANEVEKNGMGGFVFCDLPEIDATTSAGRMVLTMMASVAEFEARRISERIKEAVAATKARGASWGIPVRCSQAVLCVQAEGCCGGRGSAWSSRANG